MTISQDWNTAWEWFYSNADENEDPVTEAVADGKATNYYLWWIGLIVIYVLYYLMMVVGKPKVICSGNRLKEAIIEYCPILFECYWPTVWAFNNHVMTIVRAKCQRCPVIQYDRHLLQLADGGQLAMDWLDMRTQDTDLPVLLIMPGLTGSSQANYIRYLVKDGESQGFRPVVFNQRGNGGVDLLTPRTYCAANTEDLREVLNNIRSRYPKVPIVGVGVSLGAMLLTKYLTETGEESEIAGVVAVSALWDSHTSCNVLEQFPSRQLYNWFLSRKMRNMVRRSVPKLLSKFSALPYDMEEIRKGTVCSDFDRSCTIKVFGYPTVTDYYDDVNAHQLHLIKRPMICIQAEDDPFAPQKTLPYSRFKENENMVLVTTTHGGHFGFLEGLLPFGMSWMNRVVQQSLCVLKNTAFQPFDEGQKAHHPERLRSFIRNYIGFIYS